MLSLRVLVAAHCCLLAVVCAGEALLGSSKKTVCINDCSGHGKCLQGLHACECFPGYLGADCSRRTCPLGTSWTDRAQARDTAHAKRECSNAGICDQQTGACECFPGFSGQACERTECPNGCNGHGRCLTMSEAARMYDGRSLQHRTTYDNWDAYILRGCVCDAGFEGYDCSLLTCQDGVHPLELDKSPEQAFLHCYCEGSQCVGSFKLRMRGEETLSIPLSSTPAQVLAVVRKRGVLFPSVEAVKSSNAAVCVDGVNVTTTIIFKRAAGNMPPIDVLPSSRNIQPIAMLSKLLVSCACEECDGYFRLGFQNVFTNAMRLNTSLATITEELEALPSLQQHMVRVSVTGGMPSDLLCERGADTVRTIEIYGRRGNLEQFTLTLSASDAVTGLRDEDILSMQGFDGAAKRLPCNGVGRCDKQTGNCHCVAGFSGTQDSGPCGAIVQPTFSDHTGQQQCPGATTADGTFKPLDYQRTPTGYLSVTANESMPDSIWTQRELYPMNGSYIFKVPFLSNAAFNLPEYEVFYAYEDNATAGALALDLFHNALYVAHNKLPGILQIHIESRDVQTFVTTETPVWGMAVHLPVGRSKYLYWTTAGEEGIPDGGIFRAKLDINGSPLEVQNLTQLVHPIEVADPRGIAVHYESNQLYWTDVDLLAAEGVIYCADIDDWGSVIRIALPSNATRPSDITIVGDLVYFVDEASGVLYSFNSRDAVSDGTEFQVRATTTFQKSDSVVRPLREPHYLSYFETHDTLWITERDREYISVFDFKSGAVEAAHSFYELGLLPVDVVFDADNGFPDDMQYLDCNGHGVCRKSELGYMCQCHDGYVGDCTARVCPTGPTWFSEASGSNIARTETAECGMMGMCNQQNATCECAPSFYGSTCQYRQCVGDGQCSDSGACLSMRELARQHRGADEMPAPQQYGSDAAGPMAWDADRLFGCACDRYGFWTPDHLISDYIGSICTNRPCVSSPDPVEVTKLLHPQGEFEVQSLRCNATSGSMRLGFRGDFTDSISATASVEELKAALQQLPTVGRVEVHGDTMCGDSSVNITFLSFFGGVPELQVDAANLDGAVEVVEAQAATHATHECAGHGLCNLADGTCSCFPAWYHSDGFGDEGSLQDCGFTPLNSAA